MKTGRPANHFRKDNGKTIGGVCRQFVVLCQQLGLFSEALVAIDRSKFKAVNNRDRNFTSAKVQRRWRRSSPASIVPDRTVAEVRPLLRAEKIPRR